MRLRLEINRYQLPPTRILWNAQDNQTVAEFLHRVHELVPLETELWGLEDYSVKVVGYEVLHYQQLGQVLKDEDVITIQPLEVNDLRIRRLSGRHQITTDGRHLIDGVAFGRPLLRTPVRPYFHIPHRISDGPPVEDEDDEDLEVPQLDDEDQVLAIEDASSDDAADEDLFEDSDRPSKRRKVEAGKDRRVSAKVAESRGALSNRITRDKRRVSFEGLISTAGEEDDGNYDDEDDSEDDDFVLNEDSESLLSASGYSQDDDEDPDRAPDQAQTAPIKKPKPIAMMPRAVKERQSGISKSVAIVPTSSAKSVNDPPDNPHNPPGTGSKQTKSRNLRKKRTRKLEYLKQEGILGEDATFNDLRAYLLESGEAHLFGIENNTSEVLHEDGADVGAQQNTVSAHHQKPMSMRNRTLPQSPSTTSSSDSSDTSFSDSSELSSTDSSSSEDSDESSNESLDEGPETQSNVAAKSLSEEMQKKREALLASLNDGGVDINGDLSANQSNQSTADQAAQHTTQSRRPRLDAGGSARMILGSLGLRAPKTAAERTTLQNKVAAKTQRKPATRPRASETDAAISFEPAVDQNDPDFWKQHIELTSVECCPGVTDLPPTPTFPYTGPSWNKSNPSSTTKKRKHDDDAYDQSTKRIYAEDEDQSYFAETNGDALDYGDEEGHVDDFYDESPRYHEQELNGQLEEDLPYPPADPSSLPILTSHDPIAKDDIITFTRFECSALTHWRPDVAPLRVAQVLSISSDGAELDLQLARRDCPGERMVDWKGKKVYEGFEMEGTDDEGDIGQLTVPWAEIVEARMLVKAQGDVTVNDDKTEQGIGLGIQKESDFDVDDTLAGLDLLVEDHGATQPKAASVAA